MGTWVSRYDLEVLISLFVENLEDQIPREFQSRASIIRTNRGAGVFTVVSSRNEFEVRHTDFKSLFLNDQCIVNLCVKHHTSLYIKLIDVNPNKSILRHLLPLWQSTKTLNPYVFLELLNRKFSWWFLFKIQTSNDAILVFQLLFVDWYKLA